MTNLPLEFVLGIRLKSRWDLQAMLRSYRQFKKSFTSVDCSFSSEGLNGKTEPLGKNKSTALQIKPQMLNKYFRWIFLAVIEINKEYYIPMFWMLMSGRTLICYFEILALLKMESTMRLWKLNIFNSLSLFKCRLPLGSQLQRFQQSVAWTLDNTVRHTTFRYHL